MRFTTQKFLAAASLTGIILTGCEWTSSDGISAWSNKYDFLNFSGTYRINVAPSTGGGATTSDEVATENVNIGSVNNAAGFSKTLRPNLVAGSVMITITSGGNSLSWNDDGSGVLTCTSPLHPVPGAVNYDSGAISLVFNGNISGDVSAAFSYNYTAIIPGEDGEMFSISHVTVSHTGENLEMHFSNGMTLSGKFTSVAELSVGYNAGFEVSKGGTKFIGTLNSTTAQRLLDGTLMYNGGYYDIKGIANGSAGAAVN